MFHVQYGSVSAQEHEIQKLAREMGIFRTRDVTARGISKATLSRLVEQGELERVARGTYRLSSDDIDIRFALGIASRKVDKSVVCLISALAFHEMTTQLPHQVWLGLASGRTLPTLKYPSLQCVSMSEGSLFYGTEEHVIEKVKVKITSPAKTVADCFKCRHRVGLDVALEALRDYWYQKKGTVEELLEAAEVCRVSKLIRPYLEATLG